MKMFTAIALFMTVTMAAFAAGPAIPAGTATGQPGANHTSLAAQCREKAAMLDAQGAAYEQAAATYRNRPMVKNLASPTTSGRYEWIAKTYRDQATAERTHAASHENMAKLSSGL